MKTIGQRIEVDAELRLVPRHPSDASEMFGLVDRHRAALRNWLTWIDATHGPSDVRRYAQFAQGQFEQHAAFDYTIRRHDAIVGSIGLHHLDWSSRKGEIGYWLVPPAEGRGIMTRSCAALTTTAFERFGLNRLEIHCVVENARSRALAERVGYVFEGVMREAYLLHGAFRDLALYAMTAAAWPQVRSSQVT